MSIEPNPLAKRSPVELIKENSQQLRGTLGEELATDSDHFNDSDKQLIKFHGSYQQDNRDARKDRQREGAGKSYMFMVRCKIPGGKLTASQYLAMDQIAERYANGTLRITSRQGFQIHGVLKANLKQTIADINQCLLTTLGACGDVSRNVMAPAAPFATPVLAWADAHGYSVMAWAWNPWGGTNTLIQNTSTYAPTPGLGQTYHDWTLNHR